MLLLVSADLLRAVMPEARRRADAYAAPISRAMMAFEIVTPARIAGFLATVAVESGQLRYPGDCRRRGLRRPGRPRQHDPGDGRRYPCGPRADPDHRPAQRHRMLRALFGDDRLLEPPETSKPRPGHRHPPPGSGNPAASMKSWTRDFLGACALINTGQRVAPNSRINGLAERLSFYSRANRALSGSLTMDPITLSGLFAIGGKLSTNYSGSRAARAGQGRGWCAWSRPANSMP